MLSTADSRVEIESTLPIEVYNATLEFLDSEEGQQMVNPALLGPLKAELSRQLSEQNLTAQEAAREKAIREHIANADPKSGMVCFYGRNANALYLHTPGRDLLRPTNHVKVQAALLALMHVPRPQRNKRGKINSVILIPDLAPRSTPEAYVAVRNLLQVMFDRLLSMDDISAFTQGNNLASLRFQRGYHCAAMSPTFDQRDFRWAPHLLITANEHGYMSGVKTTSRDAIYGHCIARAISAIQGGQKTCIHAIMDSLKGMNPLDIEEILERLPGDLGSDPDVIDLFKRGLQMGTIMPLTPDEKDVVERMPGKLFDSGFDPGI